MDDQGATTQTALCSAPMGSDGGEQGVGAWRRDPSPVGRAKARNNFFASDGGGFREDTWPSDQIWGTKEKEGVGKFPFLGLSDHTLASQALRVCVSSLHPQVPGIAPVS